MADARTGRRIPHGARVLRPLRGGAGEGMGAPLAIGETTDDDARRARADGDARAEWGRMIFTRCDSMAIIVRDGDDGTHGWQYGTHGSMYRDWAEIAAVALRLQASGDGTYWTKGEA